MYVILSYANELLAGNPAWDDLTDTEKEKLLELAELRIDSQIFRGVRLEDDQTSEFPRLIDGVEVAVNERLKTAVCFTALDRLGNKDLERGVTSVKIGDASETYSQSAVYDAVNGKLSPESQLLLRPYLARAVAL